jgi:excisionase family DNA binding protein
MQHVDTPSAELTPVLSVVEAAEFLSCSRWHVYRLIEAGELTAIDISTPGSATSKTRIRQSDLSDYLARATLH